MNRPHLTIVRIAAGGAGAGVGFDAMADELDGIKWELEGYREDGYTPAPGLVEAIYYAERAAASLRLMLPPPPADFAAKLAALDELCAHCGHDAGDHLVEAPHACEAEDPDGEPCGCAGFLPPGRFRHDTIHDRPTEPAGAGDEHEAAL